MRLYLGGPMRHYPEHNFPLFNAAAEWLAAGGHEVFNPADLAHHGSLKEYMVYDLPEVAAAEGVALLPGWEESQGACLEVVVAYTLGVQLYSVDLVHVGLVGFSQLVKLDQVAAFRAAIHRLMVLA
jgi:hypothetical protein